MKELFSRYVNFRKREKGSSNNNLPVNRILYLGVKNIGRYDLGTE